MDFFGLRVCRVVRGPPFEAAVVPKQDQLEFRKVGISQWPRELCHSWCKEKILLLLHKTNLLFLASFSFFSGICGEIRVWTLSSFSSFPTCVFLWRVERGQRGGGGGEGFRLFFPPSYYIHAPRRPTLLQFQSVCPSVADARPRGTRQLHKLCFYFPGRCRAE